jgi:hypothetical protein
MKRLFEVNLNWYGETHRFYRHAFLPEGGLNYACQAVAEKLGVSRQRVSSYFDGSRDNYEVKEVK